MRQLHGPRSARGEYVIVREGDEALPLGEQLQLLNEACAVGKSVSQLAQQIRHVAILCSIPARDSVQWTSRSTGSAGSEEGRGRVRGRGEV